MKKLQEEAYNKRKSPARLPGLTTNLTTKYVTTDNFDRHSAICDRSQRRKKKKQISVKIHRKKEEDRLFSSRSSWWEKKKKTDCFPVGLLGGGRWIRTTEGIASRFTVCPLWPLGNSPIFKSAVWSWWTDSNPRPADYKSAALPTELHQHLTGIARVSVKQPDP